VNGLDRRVSSDAPQQLRFHCTNLLAYRYVVRNCPGLPTIWRYCRPQTSAVDNACKSVLDHHVSTAAIGAHAPHGSQPSAPRSLRKYSLTPPSFDRFKSMKSRIQNPLTSCRGARFLPLTHCSISFASRRGFISRQPEHRCILSCDWSQRQVHWVSTNSPQTVRYIGEQVRQRSTQRGFARTLCISQALRTQTSHTQKCAP
jgi:hypothetical protein